VLETYQHGPEAVVALVITLMSELAAQVETVSARVGALEAENATLRATLDTNSHNSSKPPSLDGPGSKPHPKSQRAPSGRQPGGQPGHAGHTLVLSAVPDEVQVHAPSRCRACRQSLDDVPALRQERRQVIDIPPVKAWVLEHQAVTKCCPDCGAETSGEFPLDVAAPVQYGPGVATLAVYLTRGAVTASGLDERGAGGGLRLPGVRGDAGACGGGLPCAVGRDRSGDQAGGH